MNAEHNVYDASKVQYCCNICSTANMKLGALRKHIATKKHMEFSDKVSFVFRCVYCNKRIQMIGEYIDHSQLCYEESMFTNNDKKIKDLENKIAKLEEQNCILNEKVKIIDQNEIDKFNYIQNVLNYCADSFENINQFTIYNFKKAHHYDKDEDNFHVIRKIIPCEIFRISKDIINYDLRYEDEVFKCINKIDTYYEGGKLIRDRNLTLDKEKYWDEFAKRESKFVKKYYTRRKNMLPSIVFISSINDEDGDFMIRTTRKNEDVWIFDPNSKIIKKHIIDKIIYFIKEDGMKAYKKKLMELFKDPKFYKDDIQVNKANKKWLVYNTYLDGIQNGIIQKKLNYELQKVFKI